MLLAFTFAFSIYGIFHASSLSQQHDMSTSQFYRIYQTALFVFHCWMFSASFPRRGRSPLRIGQRPFTADNRRFHFGVAHRVIVTGIFIYLDSNLDWYCWRCSCSHHFVFWSCPTEILDPPVAIAAGPDSASDSASSPDVSTIMG